MKKTFTTNTAKQSDVWISVTCLHLSCAEKSYIHLMPKKLVWHNKASAKCRIRHANFFVQLDQYQKAAVKKVQLSE